MLANYTISDVLGFVSIGCWLGAQFPQIVENIRRQSCEGLALPFLANWFIGDISNLLGCILTQQLPFQTYLATYFVLVDFMLLFQYIYYYKSSKTLPPIHGHLRSPTAPLPSRRLSVERYRTLSAVASSVAAAAALAALQDGQDEIQRTSRYSHRTRLPWQTTEREIEHEEDREPPQDMLESFYSEGGRDSSSRRISWSIERQRNRATSLGHARQRPPPPLNIVPSDTLSSSQAPEVSRGLHTLPGSSSEPSEPLTPTVVSRATRRGSTLVFLGVWALFGLGTLTKRQTSSGVSADAGRVLSSAVYHDSFLPVALEEPRINYVQLKDVSNLNTAEVSLPDHPTTTDNTRPSQQALGRIFAWLCTTLYFTSRLPQIWKNYVRKSVEGLSMYLFVFAFLGNTFYVASIMLSPKRFLPPPEASNFIRESIPYLIGSAGTLMFDITIVSQSFCYRPRSRRHLTANYVRLSDEEETGLVSNDTHGSADTVNFVNRGRTSRGLTSP